MNDITHALCEVCWYCLYASEPAARVRDSIDECCLCGMETRSGIYVNCEAHLGNDA